MKSLREWIADQLAMLPSEGREEAGTLSGNYEAGMRDGFITAMSALLKELQAREEAGQGDEAAYWRNLLREVLVGDTTMDERADLMRDMGIERKGDAERVNENVKAMDGYAAVVLEEKEGGAE